jgi:hypothetical protein
MTEIAAQRVPFARAHARDLPLRWFWAAVAANAVALAAVLGLYLQTWPPHEDETLALFIGRGSLPHVLSTVIADRGGAPLHFVLAWIVVHLGGGLTALRVVSLLFAVGSVPAIAVLCSQLADRYTGVVSALLASFTWVSLFHGIYGRMYSLFLFTSALSFIAMLAALERGGRKRFALWGIALLATLASHPYAVLVVGAQALYVLLRGEGRRAAMTTLAVVAVAATPFWWADVVLRSRFDVGVGGGGARLGSPSSVLHYFWWVSGDFSAGHHAWSTPVLLLAAVGFVLLALRRNRAALLVGCVVAVPALAFMLARLHATASPEARHLIFALPFFSILLATAIVDAGRIRPPATAIAAVAAIAVLVVGEVRWAHLKTPALFDGDPPGEVHARAEAAAWLASSSRPNDVLLGYEPVYLLAWERNRSFSKHALPRADPKLFESALRHVPQPLGRGVWAFDASDTTNVWRRETIRFALPTPASLFEGRAYGPYLIIRTRRPLVTRANYIAVAEDVLRLGSSLEIGDADVNLHTILVAARRIYGPSGSRSRSRSTISR